MSAPEATPSAAAQIAAAALAVPGVAELHGGAFGEIATYLPGERVVGVTVGDAGARVHITVYSDQDVREVAAAVRRDVEAATGLKAVVTVEDVIHPGDD
ncbi:Asp23/Gls24 family envelope stress response protein [Rhodococcus sp. D2-41]|uniref:Asp23/Gls24 family envelope stress response protein n=1 Tax=Speluncibacter jeojiensis TaxID=2710754 RepID=A0A9X4RHY6_9ACTN|nr:hypothetical protein [Rhodococcus sp. D2-41]MDG3009079.1 Asp23/Gls24 family envelope stress response protein [Rhodococcus sp. D2-41]MDG3015591.1 hypothetical protein [Corynebacteriales bacterium D3-21]